MQDDGRIGACSLIGCRDPLFDWRVEQCTEILRAERRRQEDQENRYTAEAFSSRSKRLTTSPRMSIAMKKEVNTKVDNYRLARELLGAARQRQRDAVSAKHAADYAVQEADERFRKAAIELAEVAAEGALPEAQTT